MELQHDSIFMVASITNPVTVTAAIILVQERRLHLDDRVVDHLPAFDASHDVRVRHLLSHISGLPDSWAGNHTLRRRQAPLAEYVREQTDDYLANAQDFAGKWYGLNVDGMVQFLKESYPHILSVRKIQDDEEAIRRLAQQLCHDPLCHFNFDQKVRTSDCSLRVMSLSCRMTDR